MKTKLHYLTTLAIAGGFLAACSNDDPNPEVPAEGDSRYVFQIQSVGSDEETATYIVPVADISQGSVSTTGVGTETDGYSFINQNNRIFGLVWGGQGPITPYKLNKSGKIEEVGNTINAVVALAYGPVNDDAFVFTSLTSTKENPTATIMSYDAKNLQISSQNSFDITKISGNDEVAILSGIFQVDNKLYAPFYCAPGVAGQNTKYKDNTWVAVFDYPSLKFEKVITDDRTGVSGFWFCQRSLRQIGNGDTYVWSGAFGSKNPSAFIRIKKGTEEFDQSYFFDVEAKTGGKKIVRGNYLANGKFLVALLVDEDDASERDGGGPVDVKLAIADVLNETITYINGTPEYEAPWYDFPVYTEADGKTAQFVLRESPERYAVYAIDIESASATRGLEIIGSNVSSISKLTME